MTIYISTLSLFATSLSWSANPKCIANDMLSKIDNSSRNPADIDHITEIKKFQGQRWKKRYSRFFESQDGKPPLCEEVGETEEERRVIPTLKTIELMMEFPGPGNDHIQMQKKLSELTGHSLQDSQRIFMENVFRAGVGLTHTSNPTAQQIYDAIKNAR